MMDATTNLTCSVVVAHNPQQAAEQTANRQARIDHLRQRADQLMGKLDSQDAGKVRSLIRHVRGRSQPRRNTRYKPHPSQAYKQAA